MPEVAPPQPTRKTRRGREDGRARPGALAVALALVVAFAWLASRDDASGPPASDAGRAATPTPVGAPDAPGGTREPPGGDAPFEPAPASPEALAPGLLDGDEAWIDEHGTPSREFVRRTLDVAIRDHFPSHKLSEADVEVLTDSVLRIREARRALAELPETDEVAPLRRELIEEIEDAGATFAEVMDMGLESFTAGAGDGVDAFDPRDPVPPGEFLTEPR